MPTLSMGGNLSPLTKDGRVAFVPRVFLSMPYYGQVHMGAAKGFFVAMMNSQQEDSVPIEVMGSTVSSLLPHTFNMALAGALEARDAGQITHFAMIHADVEPSATNWLDILWQEMDHHQADVMSVVIPIKEPVANPKTSTAVASITDPWAEPRCLTLDDIGRLPQTFGRADACQDDELLLVNTGLWLADLRRPYWNDFAFRFTTRMTKRDGEYVPQIRPEDWEMSRDLHAAGAKLMATRKVRVAHHGSCSWDNLRPAATATAST